MPKNPKSDVPYRDWINVDERKPTDYDLVYILFDNDLIQPAWWTGQVWDAGKKLQGDNVIAWKAVMAHYI